MVISWYQDWIVISCENSVKRISKWNPFFLWYCPRFRLALLRFSLFQARFHRSFQIALLFSLHRIFLSIHQQPNQNKLSFLFPSRPIWRIPMPILQAVGICQFYFRHNPSKYKGGYFESIENGNCRAGQKNGWRNQVFRWRNWQSRKSTEILAINFPATSREVSFGQD